jgi:hypothetical protein
MALFAWPGLAQIPVPNRQPLPPGQDGNAGKQGSIIKVDVGLVVLHTSVLDDRGKFADGLKEENFRIFEDKVEQKLTTFKREDVPVSMGLVIDNSGSMRDKRPRSMKPPSRWSSPATPRTRLSSSTSTMISISTSTRISPVAFRS